MSTFDFPIEQLSLQEKLALMEKIWADLSSRPEEFPSPSWHGDLLDKRREAVAKGEVEFARWGGSEGSTVGKNRHQSTISCLDGLIGFFIDNSA